MTFYDDVITYDVTQLMSKDVLTKKETVVLKLLTIGHARSKNLKPKKKVVKMLDIRYYILVLKALKHNPKTKNLKLKFRI